MRHKAYRISVFVLTVPDKQQRSVNIDTLAYPVDIRVLLFEQVVEFIDLGVIVSATDTYSRHLYNLRQMLCVGVAVDTVLIRIERLIVRKFFLHKYGTEYRNKKQYGVYRKQSEQNIQYNQ